MGRAPGTEGFELAANYVAEVWQEAGVQEGAPGWRQPVPLMAIDPDSVEGTIELAVSGEPVELIEGETVGFYPPSDVSAGGSTATGSGQVVFAGHGIVAPELGIDAYDGIDVDGKIVMMFSGAPEIEDPAYHVHLRRFDTKRAEAERRGAAGIIYLDKEDRDIAARTGFRPNHKDGYLSLGAGFEEPMPVAVMTLDPVRTLFASAGLDLDQVIDLMDEGQPVSLPLAATASLTTSADAVAVPTYNVVGVVPGTDPALANEAVVVTAHLDHLGTRHRDSDEAQPDEGAGDQIYNGAMDNAMGTAIIMEAATRLAAEGGARRPVIFAAVTAEESGLLGSAHLARNVEELGYRAIANINVDMPVLTYPLNDVIGFGEKYSTLGEHLRDAAREVGLEATPDPLPQLSLFVRSDHYRFVQEGVPALFLFNGMSGEGQEGFETFMATHYHKPSDEVTLPINWEDAATFTALSYDLIKRIANDPEAPRWYDNVVFAPDEPQG
jgi:hypothetical protein